MLPRGANSGLHALPQSINAFASSRCADSGLSVNGLVSSQASHCFPPNAMFKQVNGTFITASQLKKDGGEILLGPGDSHVRVIRTRRHDAKERYFFKIHTSKSMLEVTDDHRVIGQCPDGSQAVISVVDMQPQILTGTGPQPIQQFEVNRRSSEVIEPIFENDASVMVWTRCGRRFTCDGLEQAFAVKGGLCDVYSFFEIHNGFFGDVHVPQIASERRSRSADSSLAPADRRRLARARSSAFK